MKRLGNSSLNILLTSVGRRNYLVTYFQQALEGRGRVLAADADPNAAALQVADQAFVVPRFNDPSYIEFLVEVCRSHHVGLLISLNDLELPLLAQEKEAIEKSGAIALVSRPDLIESCLDKWAAFLMLSGEAIDTPLTFNSLQDARHALQTGKLDFPVFVKPRWGTGSIGIELVHSYEELEWAYNLLARKIRTTILADISRQDADRAVLIQEFVRGSEFGLDIINDLDGRFVCTLPKRKISMRAGETDKAVTVDLPELHELGRKLGALLKHVGVMDCDVLVTDDGRVAVLELNPRFGGGYPFSHVAGANIPAAILAWAEGQEPKPEWLRVRPGVTAAKYDLLTLVEEIRTT